MRTLPTAEEITLGWGERCPDYAEDCPCCQMWAMHDRIETLEKALEPFANSDMRFRFETGHCESIDSCVAGVCDFTVGDLLDARAALDAKTRGEA